MSQVKCRNSSNIRPKIDMRFNILGSGSSGNAALVVAGETRVLVDCGLPAREIGRRLAEVGETADRISAIVITHEHSDHIRGLAALAKSLNIRVCVSSRAFAAARIAPEDRSLNIAESIKPDLPFEIDSLTFRPVSVPHDSVDPVVFAIEAHGVKIAIVTDLGHIPKTVSEKLKGCDAIVIEANHDLDRLKASSYPWRLKQRVMGKNGHLSNDEMARFLREDYDGHARYVVLAHLSRENNHPEIALMAAREALAVRAPLFSCFEQEQLMVARHDKPLGWIDL
jgi:phosphoribosyl 1,2-cyclic phosphodiesterase